MVINQTFGNHKVVSHFLYLLYTDFPFLSNGILKPVAEEKILLVTKSAIKYFKNVNFDDLTKKIQLTEENDKYLKIAKQYPMAWKALIQLGKCNSKKLIYDKVKIEKK